jgi:hypothetical protein
MTFDDYTVSDPVQLIQEQVIADLEAIVEKIE